MLIRGTSTLATVLICLWLGVGGGVLASEQETPAQLELREILRAIRPVAAKCAGSNACFAAMTRPFGPLAIELGHKVGQSDPEYARKVLAFSFGAAGAGAQVEPGKLANDFHCGPPCADRRLKDLMGSLPALRSAAAAFKKGGYQLIALWPDERVRVDDAVLVGDHAIMLQRTKLLGVAHTWDMKGEAVAAGKSQLAARQLAKSLSATSATAIAKEHFGGVRVIHKDSLGGNEAGLIFIDAARAALIDPRPLPDGNRYQWIQPVAPGVLFYIRT